MYGILKYDHSDERFGVVFFYHESVDQITLKKTVDKIKAEKPFYLDNGAVDIGSGDLILSPSLN